MKKAIIKIGSSQYLVAVGDKVVVDLMADIKAGAELEFPALMVVEEDKSVIGAPEVKGVVVRAKVLNEEPLKGDKVRVIRYKAKKRVHKEMGHRQKYSEVEIVSIG